MVSFILFLLLFGGCSPITGRIYTHTREPYTQDLNNTPVTNIHSDGMVFHIAEPVSGYNFYIELNSNAIGDIAKKHGMKKVYFADLEIFEILGLWRHERLHLYGE